MNRKKYGILEFNEETSGYNFTKKDLTLAVIAVAIFILSYIVPIPGLSAAAVKTLGVLLATVILWSADGIPRITVSAIAVIVLVMQGMIGWGDFARSVGGDSPLFMILGMFIVSSGMARTNLAKRIAYGLMLLVGTKPRAIVFVMVTTAALMSMLVVNVPAIVMVASIAKAMLEEMSEEPGSSRLGKACMIGIIGGASIGGMALISSNGTNATVVSLIEGATGYAISFSQWAAFGVPFTILMLLPITVVLCLVFRIPKSSEHQVTKGEVQTKIKNLGGIQASEGRYFITLVVILALFMTTGYTGLKNPQIALIGMVLVSLPGWGVVNIKQEFKNLPWELLCMTIALVPLATIISSTGLGEWIINLFIGGTSSIAIVPLLLLAGFLGIVMHMIAPTTVVIVFTPMIIALAQTTGASVVLVCMAATACMNLNTVYPYHPDTMLTIQYGYYSYKDITKYSWIVAVPWLIIAVFVPLLLAQFVPLGA